MKVLVLLACVVDWELGGIDGMKVLLVLASDVDLELGESVDAVLRLVVFVCNTGVLADDFKVVMRVVLETVGIFVEFVTGKTLVMFVGKMEVVVEILGGFVETSPPPQPVSFC